MATTSSKERRRPPPSWWPSSPAKTSPRRRRHLPHRARCRQGPGDLDGRCRGPPRPQVEEPSLRWLQGAPLNRPGLRADRRDRRHPGEHPRPEAADLLEDTPTDDKPTVLGDSAYADGQTRKASATGVHPHGKVPADPQRDRWVRQGPLRDRPRGGTVTCPAGQSVAIITRARRRRACRLQGALRDVSAAHRVHGSSLGRVITIHPHEAIFSSPGRTAPARMVRALPRGPTHRGTQDRPPRAAALGRTQGTHPGGSSAWPPTSTTSAGAINWARLAVLGLRHDGSDWVLGTI